MDSYFHLTFLFINPVTLFQNSNMTRFSILCFFVCFIFSELNAQIIANDDIAVRQTKKTNEFNFQSWGEHNYIIKRSKVANAELSTFFAQHFPTMFRSAGEKGIDIQGMPSALYYSDSTSGSTDVAAALELGDKEGSLEGYETIQLKSPSAISHDYYGPYEKSASAYGKIKAEIKRRGLTHHGPIIQEYITDPMEEPDSSKWLTRITFLVKPAPGNEPD